MPGAGAPRTVPSSPGWGRRRAALHGTTGPAHAPGPRPPGRTVPASCCPRTPLPAPGPRLPGACRPYRRLSGARLRPEVCGRLSLEGEDTRLRKFWAPRGELRAGRGGCRVGTRAGAAGPPPGSVGSPRCREGGARAGPHARAPAPAPGHAGQRSRRETGPRTGPRAPGAKPERPATRTRPAPRHTRPEAGVGAHPGPGKRRSAGGASPAPNANALRDPALSGPPRRRSARPDPSPAGRRLSRRARRSAGRTHPGPSCQTRGNSSSPPPGKRRRRTDGRKVPDRGPGDAPEPQDPTPGLSVGKHDAAVRCLRQRGLPSALPTRSGHRWAGVTGARGRGWGRPGCGVHGPASGAQGRTCLTRRARGSACRQTQRTPEGSRKCPPRRRPGRCGRGCGDHREAGDHSRAAPHASSFPPPAARAHARARTSLHEHAGTHAHGDRPSRAPPLPLAGRLRPHPSGPTAPEHRLVPPSSANRALPSRHVPLYGG